MNLRALTFGCVIGLSLAVVPSCGGGGGGGTGGGSGTTGGGTALTGGGSGSTGGGSGTTGGGTGGTTGGGTGGTTGGGTGGTTGGGTGGTTGGGTGGTTGGGTGGTTGGGTGSTGGGTGSTTCVPTSEQSTCASGSSCFPINSNGDAQCFPGACTIVHSNCTTAGQGCVFAQTGPSSFGTTCTAVGDAGVGETCAGATACRPGLACLGNGTSGACTQWCYQDSDCGQGGFCNIYVTLATQLGHGAFACSFPTACDPLAPTCTSGDGCYIVNVSGTTLNFGCTTAGAVPAGSTCAASNDCVPGTGCVPEQDGGATCHTFCNPDAGAPSCGSGTCEPVNAAVGVCP